MESMQKEDNKLFLSGYFLARPGNLVFFVEKNDIVGAKLNS